MIICDVRLFNSGSCVSVVVLLALWVGVVQARMAFPIKFNGQLFTANKPKSEGGSGVDSRDWGGLSWWQVANRTDLSNCTAQSVLAG